MKIGARVKIISPTSTFLNKYGMVTNFGNTFVSVDFGEGAFRFCPSEVELDWYIAYEDEEYSDVQIKQRSTGVSLQTRKGSWAEGVLDKLNSF